MGAAVGYFFTACRTSTASNTVQDDGSSLDLLIACPHRDSARSQEYIQNSMRIVGLAVGMANSIKSSKGLAIKPSEVEHLVTSLAQKMGHQHLTLRTMPDEEITSMLGSKESDKNYVCIHSDMKKQSFTVFQSDYNRLDSAAVELSWENKTFSIGQDFVRHVKDIADKLSNR